MGSIDSIKPLSTALSIAFKKSHNIKIKFLGEAKNQNQGRWVQSKNAIHCDMRAP